ncbi:2-acyl-glycerophospho-ethanolamine acyltransferase [Virgibacillus doumboii]|uniref:2-acyl-glycerophospho-ethanolamine acyltransferase n=1 Tax=Virgibacillus doumboii TaxID=2697503 RepID=UPI0013DF9A62|nr:2-acyl-glycerophospho-ethanolamine acyltransferase [Virgibacillus doumboii]
MERESLNIFTKISFFTALVTIVSLFLYLGASAGDMESVSSYFAFLAFYGSLFGVHLSVVSMFSKEKFIKRIFALVVNSLPICLYFFAFIMEFIRVFFETPP